MPQIVFLTLYLGLVSGRQPVALNVDAEVTSVRVVIDGRTAATMTRPPWRTDVDFGPELQLHKIAAIGFDANGREVARASQSVNVPRRNAEIDVVIDRDAEGTPVRARVVARHLAHELPREASVTLDDKPLALDKEFKAKLPAVDTRRPHVLAAQMKFADGSVARREVVFGGRFAESADAQLSPLAVVRTGAGDAPPAEGCFAANGVPLRVRSVDAAPAQVIVVRDPSAGDLKMQYPTTVNPRTTGTLDEGTFSHMLSPVANRVRGRDDVTSLFPESQVFNAAKIGMLFLMKASYVSANGPRQWADAVAVAGAEAAAAPLRRAVVLVLGRADDKSDYQPATVRRYLAALGVPLFVWSPFGPRPDLAASWGDVEDVSSVTRLSAATQRLRRALAGQRIAWIEADPLTAFRAEVKDGCGYARAAR